MSSWPMLVRTRTLLAAALVAATAALALPAASPAASSCAPGTPGCQNSALQGKGAKASSPAAGDPSGAASRVKTATVKVTPSDSGG